MQTPEACQSSQNLRLFPNTAPRRSYGSIVTLATCQSVHCTLRQLGDYTYATIAVPTSCWLMRPPTWRPKTLHTGAWPKMEGSHNFALCLFAAQLHRQLLNALCHGVHAGDIIILVLGDSQILCLSATIRRNLTDVQSHCAFTDVFSEAPIPRNNPVFVTTLNCTNPNRYHFCSSRTNFDK